MSGRPPRHQHLLLSTCPSVARSLLRTPGGSDHVNPAKPRTEEGRSDSTGHPSHNGSPRHLLIVEPEELVRWSLVTYMAKWFAVDSVDSRAGADRILDERRIDAVVVSDDLSDQAAEAIETHARSRNPSVCVVRTVTNPSGDNEPAPDTPRVEKPFELSKLASLLGIRVAPACRE